MPLTEGLCVFRGRTYPMRPLGDPASVVRVVLPIPVDTPPGSHWIKVELPDGRMAARQLVIRKVGFGHQSIWLSPAMLATYDSTQAKKDDRMLLEVIRTFMEQKYWRGAFGRPCRGRLSTPFGIRRTYNGWRKGWHRGLDIAAATGTPVTSPGDGVVGIAARHMLVNGNGIVINHGGGIASLYLHLSRIDVRAGQRVSKGQVIGAVGSSGAGTGPHLHWACYIHGVPIDPAALQHPPPSWK